MTRTTKKGWLGLLGRAEGATPTEEGEVTQLEGALWRAHEQATGSSTQLVETTAQLLATTARQQGIIDAIGEVAHNADGRAGDLGEPMARLAASLDRLRLVALNVGLEGARLGDPAGRALTSVADEVRAQGDRGAEALQDAKTVLHEVTASWAQVRTRANDLRTMHAQAVTQVGSLQSLAQDVVRDIEDVGTWARKLSETDPETALILSQAADHARGLINALTSLGGRARRDLVRSALGPSLQPLARALADITRGSKGDKGAE
jgi:methyl-accepting chemotaxis protein